jgi:hypothetical protein
MLCLRWFWCVGIGDNTTFVRPQLEYASFAWAPHTQSNTNKLESVQRRAARFVTGNYNTASNVTTMLNHLNWDTLQQRRLRTKAIMMYRIINGDVTSGSWFHNRIVEGKKDNLCTVVLLYGTIYFCCCPLVAALRWCMHGGGSIATSPLISGLNATPPLFDRN